MEAFLYESRQEQAVKCNLCSHRCLIRPGRRGICNVRENRSGVLHTLVYEKCIARHVDPIEKKPIFHLLPGSLAYSIATVGCNFKCLFCQNADIAQLPSDRSGQIIGDRCTPQAVVAAAVQSGCRSIAYTYTEPTIYFEFAYETARLARQAGLFNVFVTNGYMTAETLHMISPYLDAANVDLKSFSDDYYRQYCGARLSPVKETLALMKSLGILVEITTLLVTGLNDGKAELAALAGFIVESLGPDTPWHISRFHPTYKLTDRPATPLKSLRTARDIGFAAGLKYVYLGNVPGEGAENTLCPGCARVLIERLGFNVRSNRIVDGGCPGCDTPIAGIWSGLDPVRPNTF